MNGPSRIWYALEVTALKGASEAIQYGLMEAGALGTETDDRNEPLTVRGYFETPPDTAKIRESLNHALRIYEFDSSAIITLELQKIADRDWLTEWKQSWQPVQVGRFIIAPPWLAKAEAIESEPGAVATGSGDLIGMIDPVATARGYDPIIIRINPGMAFGTGTHETTRLCLKAIDKHYRGSSFLDVGTGTGILAIAAAKICQKPERGPIEIRALDIDEHAVEIAQENAALNGIAEEIDFQVGSVDDQTPSADFVCANLTAPVIVELLPALIGATCGRLVLSGILDEQVEMVQSRLAQLSVTHLEIEQDGEWIAIVA